MRSAQRFLAAIPALALLVTVALPATAQEQAPGLAVTQEIQGPMHEPRWLPWLGCWELVVDAVDYREVASNGRRVVCVAPRLDGLGVTLTTQIDNKVIAENTVIADGAERSLPEADCSGYQAAKWSADGRRLHSQVSATCAENSTRTLVGVSMLMEGGRWLELQSVSLDGGEHNELVVRHYDRLDDAATRKLGYATLEVALGARAASARAGAAAPLTVDAVLEDAELFPAAVIEAEILESGSMFDLDSNALVRLADAGVEDGVIDLMVAVSYPEEFVVDTGASYGGGGGYGGYIGYSGYFPYSCWGSYYSPFYGPYGPSCGGYGYGYGYRPGYGRPGYGGGGGYYPPRVPPSGSLYGGKVINKRGYTTPKTAVPQQSGGGGNSPLSVTTSSNSNSNALGYTVRRAVRRDGGGGGGGGGNRITGSSSSRRSNSGSVSRSGFSKPGGSSSGKAGGSSSSGTRSAKGKAKPKGGGGN